MEESELINRFREAAALWELAVQSGEAAASTDIKRGQKGPLIRRISISANVAELKHEK